MPGNKGRVGKTQIHAGFPALFIPVSNEPSSHACMDIWRLPRGSNTLLAAGYLIFFHNQV
ncbi:hypothetical protein HMPREF1548_04775 [Clostridium sp. KLE 1755]|nr:hypothetical protein HMPREF1548_04775 [Clostridium sp. KLE 1755]